MNVYGKIRSTLFAMILSSHVYEFRYIKGFKYPVHTTALCPRDRREYDERSDALNCTGENSYACLPNESITELWEFCHPLEHIHIPKDRCLFLSKTKLDLESYNCKKFDHGCPDRPYLASTIFEHPSCVSIRNGCFLADSLCESKENNLSVQETTTQKMAHEEIPANKKIIFISSSIVFGIVLVIVLALYFIWFLRRKKGGHIKKNDVQILVEGKRLPLTQQNSGRVSSFRGDMTKDIQLFEEMGLWRRHFVPPSRTIYVEVQRDDNKKFLYDACTNGIDSIVEDILEKSALLNQHLLNGLTPLCVACEHGRDSTVKLLLGKGADVNCTKTDGASPLFVAIENERYDIVPILLEKHADVNICTNKTVSPLFKACEKSHVDTINRLLKNKAEINTRSNAGLTPLLLACDSGNDTIVNLLLSYDADVNICDGNGASPFFIACRNGHENIARALLRKGSDAKLRRKMDNMSPFAIAYREGHEHIMKFLKDLGADQI